MAEFKAAGYDTGCVIEVGALLVPDILGPEVPRIHDQGLADGGDEVDQWDDRDDVQDAPSSKGSST
ncbi:MAG: hypothetical protein GY747_06915 [Planctomycetes bacterium]|nr:hypothetical protein [Planctomycetota bacterium]MCP4772464.1 hypothetical protein [Planctomycetota bacterium]MCP4860143.1 hypothetical protein [Planctomycetota bacterium]